MVKKDKNTVHPILSLAPVSVLPDYQGKGIGSALIKSGIKIGKSLGYKALIVLGYPSYYPRFGFLKASKFEIYPPVEEIPDEAFMVLELENRALDKIKGKVEYPKEYYDAL